MSLYNGGPRIAQHIRGWSLTMILHCVNLVSLLLNVMFTCLPIFVSSTTLEMREKMAIVTIFGMSTLKVDSHCTQME